MTRLGALEALGRGIANVRANLELVGVTAAGSLVLLAIVLLTLLPWLGPGGGLGSLVDLATGNAAPGDYVTLLGSAWSAFGDLWGLVLSLALGLTVASIVYCWYFGGVLAVLVAGDAQAPPGGGRESALFRTWSPRLFAAEAARLTWRLLLFYSLWLLAVLVLVLLFAALVGGATLLGAGVGAGAGLALGCGGALPLAFAGFAVLGAMSFGQVELVRPESGVGAASRFGLDLVGRRLGAAVGLVALLFAASLAAGLAEAGTSAVASVALAGNSVASAAAQGALFVVQLAVSAFLNLVLAASFVALARGERRSRPDAAA